MALKCDLEIINEKGLHARASARFVEIVEQHDSEVEVSFDGLTVAGDSIMGLLTLAASKGSTITLEIFGNDAEELKLALETLVAEKFYEES
ncbi:MAG: HPr family phosphocarrier protein [Paracoccaceae bacterium]|nr:HPr family phosphocarrier protein [Paracoccaceae bacterium]MDE2674558.1 HPr family phosphocarrier protein [Paracoccaceae bacterium]MXZ50671.1 HPr family phosphocarrier protein [Paracoccaceae bacterium]MYF46478.1 HPr family phosphocarrier protein [Paracoccaceae bacterium]MYG09414.1 HPr family phosphocarrier protein [Paracoccaceae bacterium]